ncbi:exo-beta-N-acetylmuramidase NamZ family protein [Croceiramulus getboli]|nr:DUF1343 domain-containing protein [Flavobacteriaceae bacterium YJPT1-3]
MPYYWIKSTLFLLVILVFSCQGQANLKPTPQTPETVKTDSLKSVVNPLVGANRLELYEPLLKGKRIGVVCNPSSLIFHTNDHQAGATHLVDSLLSRKHKLVKVYSPEHGFRGTADAGEEVADGMDKKTGLPLISVYGKNKKPTPEQLEGVDLLIFDIQDVGVRFYTYISTLHYLMEAAAEAALPVIVLDRPNPNGHYIDGPTLLPEHQSFLGMHPVPLVHGMTIGEYAQMINGEQWLKNGIQADLTVIPMEGYTHQSRYSLPVRPSPNLPNDQAINLYPSLGLLEGTTLNAGRGTDFQFQVFGAPELPVEEFPFDYTPEPNFGAKYPKHQGSLCHGKDLRKVPFLAEVDLGWIIEAYQAFPKDQTFFNTENFTLHAGTPRLQEQIEAGLTMEDIRQSWQPALEAYAIQRKAYLLYPLN